MVTPEAWKGVNTLIDAYLLAEPGDHVVIGYTSDTVEQASWLAVALKQKRVSYSKIWMIPLQDPELEQRLSGALPTADAIAGMLIIITLELETLSHDSVFRKALSRYRPESTKCFRAVSASSLLFTEGLRVKPEELTGRNTTLLNQFMSANCLHVTSNSGTDLVIRLDNNKYRWVSNRGVWSAGKTMILPAGEVATFPADVNGVFVADFGFNANISTRQDARLQSHPVKLEIQDGRLMRYDCGSPTVREFLEFCFTGRCSERVGEVGFGTNFGISRPVSLNSHINERHPGLHLGFGESNQPPSVVGYQCDIHLDLVGSGGLVSVDGRTLIDLADIKPSSEPHPKQTRDEDAFSSDGDGFSDDCCGLIS